eukprot:scaffold126500_cov42-Phaeocystis_antarctica.AAC.2
MPSGGARVPNAAAATATTATAATAAAAAAPAPAPVPWHRHRSSSSSTPRARPSPLLCSRSPPRDRMRQDAPGVSPLDLHALRAARRAVARAEDAADVPPRAARDADRLQPSGADGGQAGRCAAAAPPPGALGSAPQGRTSAAPRPRSHQAPGGDTVTRVGGDYVAGAGLQLGVFWWSFTSFTFPCVGIVATTWWISASRLWLPVTQHACGGRCAARCVV